MSSLSEQLFTQLTASTLTGNILAGATSLTVADATKYSTSPQFHLNIDGEVFLVTAVSGATFTVVGGQEGTTTASHSSGANVYQVLSGDALRLFTSGALGCAFSAGGFVLTAGAVDSIIAPYNGTLIEWAIVSDQPGSAVVDVWRTSFASGPPSVANTIAGSDKPTLSSAQKNNNTTINPAVWTTAFSVGDWFTFHLDSASTVTSVKVVLRTKRA